MGKVVFDTSMSLDGFMTAADQTAEEPMGEGGLRPMEWCWRRSSATWPRAVVGWVADLGASIAGRRPTTARCVVGRGRTERIGAPTAVRRHARALHLMRRKVACTRSSPTGSSAHWSRRSRPRRQERDVMGGAESAVSTSPPDSSTRSRSTSFRSSSAAARGCSRSSAIGHLELEPTEAVETPAAVHLRLPNRRTRWLSAPLDRRTTGPTGHDRPGHHRRGRLHDACDRGRYRTAWASPVWYAPVGYAELIWLSRPEARHSRNLAVRASWDRRLRLLGADRTGQGAYIEAVAEHVPEAELERCVDAYSSGRNHEAARRSRSPRSATRRRTASTGRSPSPIPPTATTTNGSPSSSGEPA